MQPFWALHKPLIRIRDPTTAGRPSAWGLVLIDLISLAQPLPFSD
jgi:hypothetical protein